MKTKLLMACVAVALPLLVSSCGSSDDKAAAPPTQAAATTPGVLVEDAWVRATVGAKDTSMTVVPAGSHTPVKAFTEEEEHYHPSATPSSTP